VIPVCAGCLELAKEDYPGLGESEVEPLTGPRRRWCWACDLRRAAYRVPAYVLISGAIARKDWSDVQRP
jgi:hypothetical protein